MDVNGDHHNGATCHDLRFGAHCRIYYRQRTPLLPSLALFLSLLPTYTAPHRIATTAVTHDVVDTLNQRWIPSSYPQREPSGRDIYLTMLRNVIPSSVSRWNTVTELHYVVTRRKQWRVPSLVWSANCTESDVWSSREKSPRPSGKDYLRIAGRP